MYDRTRSSLQAKAASTLFLIENRIDRIMQYWLLLAGLAVAARIAFRPSPAIAVEGVLPYILVLLAPFASMVLALRWLADGANIPQPMVRFARVGRWLHLSREQAFRHKLYGAGGIMVSLIIGMLLNVPIRVGEYLVSMPPVGGAAPQWFSALHLLMTLDVVVLSSLYTIAFVAALRRVPLFPRLLVFVWLTDLAMQLIIAEVVGHTPGLPGSVAAALQSILDGNIKKVLISVGLWLPYLLLSARVNVTYRHRIAA